MHVKKNRSMSIDNLQKCIYVCMQDMFSNPTSVLSNKKILYCIKLQVLT